MAGAQRDWEQTITKLYREVPAAKNVNWAALFSDDPKILGHLINDIIKVEISKRGRPGKRATTNEAEIFADFRKLRHEDYADAPFVEIMKAHSETKSLRHMARLTGLDKMVIRRLLMGEGEPPTSAQLESIAAGLKKDPGYFIEYRARYVCSAIHTILLDNSESATVFYKKLQANK
jgi:hypothetical protein